MLIDLQLHSTYSDGYLTPTEVVKMIAKKGVKVAALTDHNTVSGVDEFKRACKEYGVKAIVGLELYVKMGSKRFNMLWFNFDRKDSGLHKMLRNSQIRRRSRVRAILSKLNSLGFKISVDSILDQYNHYVPDNRIIDDIMKVRTNREKVRRELGPHAREEEIIRSYFYNQKIGRLHESYIDIQQVLTLRKKIGGQLILNHPGKYNHMEKHFLQSLKVLGIDGIEVLSPHHSIGAVMYAQHMARKLGFIMTGGSDFHKPEGNEAPIRDSWDYFRIDSKHLVGLEKIIF